jgi:signal transduction histidine kinase
MSPRREFHVSLLGVWTAVCLLGTAWTAYSLYSLKGINAGYLAPDETLFLPGHEDFEGTTLRGLIRARYGITIVVAGLGLLAIEVYRRDFRLRQRIQREEQATEQEKKLAHFEELAAGLAHEVRNPLTTIGALVYALQKKFDGQSKEYKDVALIRSEISRVNGILKEFTQLASPAPPKPALIPGALLLSDLAALMGPRLEKENIKLECHCNGAQLLYADREQLTQVLMNLVQNAAESMKSGGTINVRVSDDHRDVAGEPRAVSLIEVQDEGAGIPEEVQTRIFDPFFSTKREGTGLGLPISARIIHRHRGTVEFETELGKGTVFRIALPAHGRVD